MTGFQLSPDGSRIAVLHSSSYVPHQLGIVPAAGGALRQLTDTRTSEYKAFEGAPFEIVRLQPPELKLPICAPL